MENKNIQKTTAEESSDIFAVAEDQDKKNAAIDYAAFVMQLARPLVHDEKTYTELTFNFEDLSGNDSLAIERELQMLGHMTPRSRRQSCRMGISTASRSSRGCRLSTTPSSRSICLCSTGMASCWEVSDDCRSTWRRCLFSFVAHAENDQQFRMVRFCAVRHA